MTPGGADWAATFLRTAARLGLAIWILARLPAAWRSRPRQPGKAPARSVEPARESARVLAIVLRATGKGAIARDCIASRMHLLARDLAALDRQSGKKLSWAEWEQSGLSRNPLLAAYFQDHRLAHSPPSTGQAQPGGPFIARTREVLKQLEQTCGNRQRGK